jgi:putative ABC transport system permease protein
MKFLPLIWAGLWRKKLRTIFTFLSIVVAFLLYGMLGSVNAGFQHALEVSRMDRLFTDGRFGKPMPMAYLAQIETIPGIITVAPIDRVLGQYQEPKNFVNVGMVDERWFTGRPEMIVSKELVARWKATPTGILVSRAFAQRYNLKPGDKFPIQSTITQMDGSHVWTFDVLGVFDNADQPDSQNAVGNYSYYDEARALLKGTVFRFLVRIADPHQATAISREIDKPFINSAAPTRTTSEREANEAGLQSLGDINFFINAIVIAVLFMLGFLTANTAMQSLRERIPEFAVLKTLGFSDSGLCALIMIEALLPCIAGAVTGLIIGIIGSPHVPLGINLPAPVGIPWQSALTGIIAAALVAFVSSAWPVRRIQRLNVVDALAGR